MSTHNESRPPRTANLYMGSNSLSNSNATRYLSPGYNTGQASANILTLPVSATFVVYRIDLLVRTAGAAGQTLTGTLFKNGGATAMALATASNATTGSQTAATPISFSPGDNWYFELTKSNGFTSGLDYWYTLGIYIG